MDIIFSGTPQFSIPTLEYIHKNYNLVAIITKPDKPSGRGIFLMKHLSDEVNFSNNGSLVELSFYMS